MKSITVKEWADNMVYHIGRVRDAAKNLSSVIPPSDSPTPTSTSTGGLDGGQVAKALSEYCRSDNSVTQALAIRLSNLALKYSQRAA